MAYIQAEIKIPTHQQSINVNLYFPTDLPELVGNKVKGVVTLLHGLGGANADWGHMTAAYRYAADNGLVLVMPAATNSFYHNMAYGPDFYDIITELLPQQLNKIFNIPTDRELNYLAGLSMGGYGAFRIGLSHPERYAAVGAFSGALHMPSLIEHTSGDPGVQKIISSILGNNTMPDEANLFHLAKQVSMLPAEKQPRLFCTCGKQDFICSQTQSFRKQIKSLPLNFTYHEWDGVHEWNFWDRSLAEFIGFALGTSYGERKKTDWNTPAEEFQQGPPCT